MSSTSQTSGSADRNSPQSTSPGASAGSSRKEANWWDYCPNCGTHLQNVSCKYRCPNCHYFMSCSDFD